MIGGVEPQRLLERHNLGRTYLASLDTCNFGEIDRIINELESEAKAITRSSGAQHSFAFDLRYVGQEFSLTVPIIREQVSRSARGDIRAAFDALHEHRYAHHSPSEPVELINVRLTVLAQGPKPSIPPPEVKTQATKTRKVFLESAGATDVPVYLRQTLSPGAKIVGPALVQEYGTTTIIYAGDELEVRASGEMIISLGTSK